MRCAETLRRAFLELFHRGELSIDLIRPRARARACVCHLGGLELPRQRTPLALRSLIKVESWMKWHCGVDTKSGMTELL